jgi:hypothetical protein
VDALLDAAVRKAYKGERVLFEERAHERSIVFHIARHLASQVEASLPGWSVDVDYDRWHRPEMEEIKKQLYWRRIQRVRGTSARAEVPEDHDVYPDIIIHRRSRPSAEHDLLVVEVKKQEEERRHENDREKLRAFMGDPFRYQHAAFLLLPADGGLPYWEWIEP